MNKFQLGLALALCVLSVGAISFAAEETNNLLQVQSETQTTTQPAGTEHSAGFQTPAEQGANKDSKKPGMETGATQQGTKTPSLPTTQRHE